MSRSYPRLCLLAANVIIASMGNAEAPHMTCIEPNAATGTSRAIVVGASPMAHTAQILPLDAEGKLTGADDAEEQLDQLFQNLERVLVSGQSSLDRIVKLNVYVAREDVVAMVEQRLAERYSGPHKPAVTFIVSEPPFPGALIACDAAASAPAASSSNVTHVRVDSVHAREGRIHLSILPKGRTVYISGQAEDAASLGVATTKTLDSLKGTLAFLGLDLSHVVSIKTFFKPMSQIADVDGAIDAFFGGRVPAVVHVEWTNASPPIEIEMVAFAPEGRATPASDRINYLTPPGMTESPVYSKVTVIDNATTVHVSGITSPNAASAEEEVRNILTSLGKILGSAGSDMKHLVKATYYCATDETSTRLNEIRPQFYDPKRPPAASKALVQGTGIAGSHITVDMIAVTATPR